MSETAKFWGELVKLRKLGCQSATNFLHWSLGFIIVLAFWLFLKLHKDVRSWLSLCFIDKNFFFS